MQREHRLRLRRLAPFLVLLAVLVVLWLTGLTDLLSWSVLARHQAALSGWVAAHQPLAAAAYVLAYTAAAALSLPIGALLTATGGLLFGAILGCALAVAGATAGATLLFLAARSALGEVLRNRGGTALQGVRVRLQRDGFFYLLAIRLVPAFPFWLVNLAAALCGTPLLSYVAATLLGIIPATFVFAWIGAGLAGVLAAGGQPDFGLIVSPQVLGPLLGLAALSLLPLLLRRRTQPDA